MLVGAIAAYYKYGDRTEITDRSLKRTKEAVDGLRAYISRALAEAVRPTVERIVANAPSAESALEEVRGESFLNDVSTFVNRDIEEILLYRSLLNAREGWSRWARRISWGIFALLIIQAVFTFFFVVVVKMLSHNISLRALVITLTVSGMIAGFCFLCAGAMLYYHDQIAKYRDKVL